MQTDKKIKLIRTSTIPGSLNTFCKGFLKELNENFNYEVIALSSPGPQLEEIAERENVKTIAVKMKRQISPLQDLKSLFQLIRIFHREKPDIIHSITPKAGLLCMMAAWFCRVPIRIHTFTGLIFPTSTGIKQKILIFTDRLTCKCATHIIPEGEGVKSDLQRFKITRKPLKVLGYGNIRGIDLNYYSRSMDVIQASEAIKRDDLYTFIFIGRIVRDKGINELIDAFTRLHNENSSIRLILVGRYEDTLDPISEKTRQIIDSNDAIEAVGQQSDVRHWLTAADALVFPSYREGFPNVVIEAGAMGLPSIVTDINGCNEIIEEGKNGTIVPPRNADALYEAMKRFITDRETTAKMASKTRKMVETRFEQSYVRKCLTDFYSGILSDK